MLKIKDNVDLKELEKFGFEYRINNYREQWVIVKPLPPKKHWSWNDNHRENITVACVNRVGRILTHSTHKEVDNILFDLISAGIVEKVVY